MASVIQIIGTVLFVCILIYYLGDRVWMIAAIIAAWYVIRWCADLYWAHKDRGW